VPVSDVRSALPAPSLDGVLETQTRQIGLIYPPPDIRAIADKTAQFVAKNGRCGHIGGINIQRRAVIKPSSTHFHFWLHRAGV
jgi:hypothetical protein